MIFFNLGNNEFTLEGYIFFDMNYEIFKSAINQITDISEEDCNWFKEHLKPAVIRKNDFLVKEGQLCQNISFIFSGLCRMYYLLDGKEINVCFFMDHQFMTEYTSFLKQQPSKYYIQALEDTEIVSFSAESVEQSYLQSHSWERFGRKIAEYCYLEACSRTEAFLFFNGEQRYLKLLEESPQIFQRIPLYHIASYLGLERETLSRLRKKIATNQVL